MRVGEGGGVLTGRAPPSPTTTCAGEGLSCELGLWFSRGIGRAHPESSALCRWLICTDIADTPWAQQPSDKTHSCQLVSGAVVQPVLWMFLGDASLSAHPQSFPHSPGYFPRICLQGQDSCPSKKFPFPTSITHSQFLTLPSHPNALQ